MPLHDAILAAQLAEVRKHKRYADNALAQLRDEELFVKLNAGQCSVAAYVRHMAGNMKSRFTDFLTTDGEKPWRDREAEFDDRPAPREEILRVWEEGWAVAVAAIEGLRDGDLERVVTVRNEPHTLVLAVTRQVAHYAYHVGQIVLLAKHWVVSRGGTWNYSTIPPGGSAAFNRSKGM